MGCLIIPFLVGIAVALACALFGLGILGMAAHAYFTTGAVSWGMVNTGFLALIAAATTLSAVTHVGDSASS